MSKKEKYLLLSNAILYGFLTIFSYAYVDLNLTISQNPTVLKFVALMQQLGYYHRPQATLIYVLFLLCAFSFFIYNLWLFHKSKVSLKYLTASAVTNTLILVFAYPFLSSDLFNYLFDAKILLNYHVSPYTHKPLDFPQDDWLRFMRWVHRYSPYGPLWLVMSLVPAFLGFGKFILNFLSFKIFIAFFHLVNSFIVYKFLQKNHKEQMLLGTAFYALNPIFLIEGVANAHNDVVLATFLLAAIFFQSHKRKIISVVVLILGVLIKYIPILIFPWMITSLFKSEKNQKRTIILSLVTMGIFTYLYSSFKISVPFVSSGSTQVQFQPWYLFWTLPFIALIPTLELVTAACAITIGANFRYLPFLYYGDWSHPGTITFMQIVTILPFATIAIFILTKKFSPK